VDVKKLLRCKEASPVPKTDLAFRWRAIRHKLAGAVPCFNQDTKSAYPQALWLLEQ
jgi:hypothetical protein